MHLLIVIKFGFLLRMCQQVSSSRYLLYSKNDMFSKENFDNILEKFFVQLNKAYLLKYTPQHVTVVGASANELEQTRPLLESYPCIICKDTERCAYSKRFSQGSMVVVFLKDLSEETFGRNMKILSVCSKCKVLFVCKGIISVKEIRFVLTSAMQHVPYSELARIGQNVIEFYRDFPTRNCSVEVQLTSVWRPAFGSNGIEIWTGRSRDMNGCSLTVSSLTFTPKMMIEENENSSLTIVGGREGKLILALAEKLNFSVALRYPSMENQLKYSRKEAICNDVALGISEIGIGRLRPTNDLNNSIAISFSYDEECVTWGVPRLMNWSNNIIWVEFSWQVWSLVGLVFAAASIARYAAYRNSFASRTSEDKNLGPIVIFLDVLALHLGNPIVHVSSSSGGRFMLTASLYYAMVLTTAYKTSLASILVTDEGTPQIVDVQGIINANLKVGGSLFDYNILKDQVNDSELTSEILERFVSNNNDSESWDQLMCHQDYAFLARRSSLDYDRQMFFKAREPVTYDVLNGCVLAYPTVMVFQAKSYLRKPVDGIIIRLLESGILGHWDVDELDADKLLKRRSSEKFFEERGTNKFRHIFIVYAFCILICLLTFFIELLTRRVNSRKRHRTAN